MHVQPDPMAEVDSQAIYGTDVTILKNLSAWCFIQTPDAYTGWVEQKHLIQRSTPYRPNAKVKTLRAHVYWVSDTRPHPPKITLPFESPIEVLASEDQPDSRWQRIRLVDGSMGWMQRGDLFLNPSPLSLQEMVSLSSQFIGLPYTWGGTSSFGFDCSGFVQMLYRQMGILLPRNSSQQAEDPRGKMVDQERKEGDLLFFKKQDKVTHVGIYLKGNRCLHTKANLFEGAPIVQIHPLETPCWDDEFLFAKRF